MKSKKKFKNMKNCGLISEILLSQYEDDYDEKYMKINSNSNDELPLNKTVKIPAMTIVVWAIFLENNKYYPQVFLDECL